MLRTHPYKTNAGVVALPDMVSMAIANSGIDAILALTRWQWVHSAHTRSCRHINICAHIHIYTYTYIHIHIPHFDGTRHCIDNLVQCITGPSIGGWLYSVDRLRVHGYMPPSRPFARWHPMLQAAGEHT